RIGAGAAEDVADVDDERQIVRADLLQRLRVLLLLEPGVRRVAQDGERPRAGRVGLGRARAAAGDEEGDERGDEQGATNATAHRAMLRHFWRMVISPPIVVIFTRFAPEPDRP